MIGILTMPIKKKKNYYKIIHLNNGIKLWLSADEFTHL